MQKRTGGGNTKGLEVVYRRWFQKYKQKTQDC